MPTIIKLLPSVILKGRLNISGALEFAAIQISGEPITVLVVQTDNPPARVEVHDFKVGETDWVIVAPEGWERFEGYIAREFPYNPDEAAYTHDIAAQSASQTKSKKIFITIKPVEQGPDR